MTIRGLINLVLYLALTFTIASQVSDPFIIIGVMVSFAILLITGYHIMKPYMDLYIELELRNEQHDK